MLNFLHISLAIAGILDAQIDRALSGLEARTQVSSEVWSQFRDICDAYLLRYQDRSSLPWQDYLNMLTVRYPKKLAQLRAAFALELQPLHTVEKHIGLSGKSRTAPTHEMLLSASKTASPKPFGYFNRIFDDYDGSDMPGTSRQ